MTLQIHRMRVEGPNGSHREVDVIPEELLEWLSSGVMALQGRRLKMIGEIWKSGQVHGSVLISKTLIKAGRAETTYSVGRWLDD